MKTKMKSVLFSVIALAGLGLAVPAYAQAEGAPAEGRPPGERMDPAVRLERMKERLNLTEEQVTKIKAIFAAEREELMAKRKELGQDATQEARREAMRSIREKYRAQLDAVLTDEQKALMPKGDGMPRGPRGPNGEGAGGPPSA